jgi:15-cis-phytoene synthase
MMPAENKNDPLPIAYGICATLVRKHEPDRHVSAMFAPPDRRRHLHALQAFSLEIAGVRGQAKEALPGEMRLQWWRDALNGVRTEEVNAHPVAFAIRNTIAENSLPMSAFQNLIDARVGDLYDDLHPDWNALEGYCGETSSSLFQLACLILQKGKGAGAPEAAGHAGVAYALAGLLRALPWHARRGQVMLPQSLLTTVGLDREDIVSGSDSERLRAALAEMRAKAWGHLVAYEKLRPDLPSEIRPAFLPLASVPLYLKAMEKPNYKPFGTIIELAHWLRVWRMWRLSKSF